MSSFGAAKFLFDDTESTRLVWCFEHVTIESSSSPYDPGAGAWTFNFKRPATAKVADQIFAAVSPTKPLLTGQFQGFVNALGNGGSSRSPSTMHRLRSSWSPPGYRSARTGSVETLPLAHDHPDRDSWRPPGVD